MFSNYQLHNKTKYSHLEEQNRKGKKTKNLKTRTVIDRPIKIPKLLNID